MQRDGLEPVSDEFPRRLTLVFQDFAKEAFSSLPIAVLGHQNVQNIAILINCSPQVIALASDRDEKFVNVPDVAQSSLLPPQ